MCVMSCVRVVHVCCLGRNHTAWVLEAFKGMAFTAGNDIINAWPTHWVLSYVLSQVIRGTSWIIRGDLFTHCSDLSHIIWETMPGIYIYKVAQWWRHQMETFSVWLAICAGNSPVPVEFPSQRPVTRSFPIFFIGDRVNRWVNNREAGDLRRYRPH